MDAVKKVFGVVLLGVAIWLVSPVMPIMATMLLIGGLLVMCAIFLSAIDPLPCSRRPHLGCDRDLSEIEATTLNHPRPKTVCSHRAAASVFARTITAI